MKREELIKKYDAWIKGGFGTMAMLTVMNGIYVIRALIKKDLSLWLEFSMTEFAFKSTSYFNGYSGPFPLWAALIVVVGWSAALLFLAIKSIKRPMLLIPCTVLYAIDTALLAFIMATDRFGDYGEASWINVIVHVIMLTLFASGIYAAVKKKNLPEIETEEN